jgi:hypothetical protein
MVAFSIEQIPQLTIHQLQLLVHKLNETSDLEAIGKQLSLNQFLDLLIHLQKEPTLTTKLSPLLVGLSPYVFFQALLLMPFESVEVLKREGVLEPLQHQLNLFIHESELVNRQASEQIHTLTKEIQESQIKEWNHQDLETMQLKIEQLKMHYEELIHAINKALALTWNTTRIDLLDKLNHLKEFSLSQLQNIGSPRLQTETPSGLFAFLEQLLYNTYGSVNDSQEDIEVLDDEDSAIEGLVKFSIWYLQDYWKLGLLPKIKHVKELELDPIRYNERERIQHRQQLFNQVQQNLTELGIGKVADLKKAEIFSKKMLVEYITKYHHRLR